MTKKKVRKLILKKRLRDYIVALKSLKQLWEYGD